MMKKKKLLYWISIGIVITAILGITLFMNYKTISNLNPKGKVIIESISPSSGSIGEEITIQGFGFTPKNNDIAFTSDKINFRGKNTAYLNGISSKDGKTLRFNLPAVLEACAFSQMKENEACPTIGILLPKGNVQIFVLNENGISNKVTFTVK